MTFIENTYPFTNLVDLVLTRNRSNKPDSSPIYIDAATDESISFGEYKKLVKQATAGFQRIGLKHGDCVSIYSPNDVISHTLHLFLASNCNMYI
jgi:acyl-coenzyme A synthetase/AMP-(fatty) acid ligase